MLVCPSGPVLNVVLELESSRPLLLVLPSWLPNTFFFVMMMLMHDHAVRLHDMFT